MKPGWPSQQYQLYLCSNHFRPEICEEMANFFPRKPETSLGDPYPAPTILPKITQLDDCGDYESELAIVIGKECKNVSEADACDYVLGYTAANDVSSRTSQFAQTQWSFSKGFDGACPIGKSFPKSSSSGVEGKNSDED